MSILRTILHPPRATVHRATRGLAGLCLVGGLSGVAVIATPLTASAATTTLTAPTTLSGSTVLSSTAVSATGGGVTATFSLDTSASWTQSAAVLSTAFDPNLVRQGRSPNPADAFATPSPGSMTVTWTLNNLQVSWGLIGPLSLGSPGFTATAPCTLATSAPNYTCTLTSNTIGLLDTYPVPGPYVTLGLQADVTVTPQGIMTTRSVSFGGNPGATNPLTLTETPVTDSLSIPCTVGTGDDTSYVLGALSTDPGISVLTSLVFHVGVESPLLLVEVKVPFANPTIPLGTNSGDIHMSGAGATFDMGNVLHNNIPPTVSAGGPYVGPEGSAFSFDGSGSSSICGFPTLQWNFSDGGVAFGEYPQHTFPGSGTYSGLLTATDVTGLSTTTTFSVTVNNLPPVVAAGPDTTATWGRYIAFNGSATDPGPADQSTLVYSWDFGDGSAAGGASTFHSYATPGDYAATLTVTDQYGASSSSSRTIHVVKRATTTAYVGDATGTFATPATLQASVVDQYGQSVAARSVTFNVGTDGPFSALTNSNGLASQSYTPSLASGPYVTSASFAGDVLYNASASTASFAVAKKATTTTYTGALSSKPNKIIALSAKVVDATGTLLAGRKVIFLLGSQTTSAITSALGVASTTLTLSQKNGTYTVSATYDPTGTPPDASFYLGSSQGATFLLQSK